MVAYSDTHRVPVPSGWTATDFTVQVLSHAPRWLTRVLDLRDRFMGRLGFATQPSRSRNVEVIPGGTAGPFVFSEVNSSIVRGGNADRRIVFESTFRVELRSGVSYGVLETQTHSVDCLGAAYATIIRPAHKAVMTSVLRSAMSGVRLDG
ncbi:DUF2867 domain-containing protein [Gordonia sp. DT30]|uniref:DUF2867 domain-containing protein n=1 Tax=unclassified Gordonia (in: high G+C Gram-positive bacteria) TaxID=2657482 RepID=UPI003CF1A585